VEPGDQVNGAAPRHFEVVLAPDLGAATMARRLLEQSFGTILEQAELDRAKLAVSELATNAVRHGEGEITLRAELDETRLLVEVVDEGPGFDHVPQGHNVDGLGGWGLSLVDGTASRWGIRDRRPHVWFEIQRTGKLSD
jgi:anti-sigma regulatory factor (Ser/Thr protein kinase)